MRIGFAVKVLGEGGLASHDARRWQSGPHLATSLEYFEAILDYLKRNDLHMYRMVTNLAPYATHPDLPDFHHQLEECAVELERIGARVRAADIRLSVHPGQYTVLNSEDPQVVDSAIRELDHQAAVFDALGQGPEAKIILHVGGAAGGLEAGADRFISGFERLSASAQARLIVENDDRTYDLADVLALAERLGTPVVWDILHHHCNDRHEIPDEEALALALATWPADVVPKIHYSSPRLDMGESVKQVGRRKIRRPTLPDLRNHADLIDPIAFEAFLRHTVPHVQRDFDVMVEAKAKDLAVLRLRDQLAARHIDL